MTESHLHCNRITLADQQKARVEIGRPISETIAEALKMYIEHDI